MKKVLGILLALALAIALAAPVMADEVETKVTVPPGEGSPPIIKCKWEQDTTLNLEDGDPNHDTPGAQFLPPCVFEAKKTVQYWAVVTDPQGVDDIENVYARVYHPTGAPENYSEKYKLDLVEQYKPWCITIYENARDAGLVTYSGNYTDAEVMDELDKCIANVYMVPADLDYEQPCGNYTAVVKAVDQGGTPSDPLENCFTYVSMAAFDIDFNKVDFGEIRLCKNKWIPGNTLFDTVGTASLQNPIATIRSVGNSLMKLTVHQTDMTLGITGAGPASEYWGTRAPYDYESNWNVVFDARLGNDPTGERYFDPCVTVELPTILELSQLEELDLSIHVKNAEPDEYIGKMTLGCVPVPFA